LLPRTGAIPIPTTIPTPVRCRWLPYQQALAGRELSAIDLLVIHCTELPDLATARDYGERVLYPGAGKATGTGNSGHYYIDRDGSTEQWVELDRVAHHVRGFNERSVGIELVNLGRYPDWLHSSRQQMTEPYPAAQITALLKLIASLRLALPGLRWVAGHAELDCTLVPSSDDATLQVHRKLDPGPCFPWPEVLEKSGLLRFGA
jgi:N-acetylmuramoyl-L-alanine amidase